jgi:hypothetical protein
MIVFLRYQICVEVIKDQQDMVGICAIKWWDGPKNEKIKPRF